MFPLHERHVRLVCCERRAECLFSSHPNSKTRITHVNPFVAQRRGGNGDKKHMSQRHGSRVSTVKHHDTVVTRLSYQNRPRLNFKSSCESLTMSNAQKKKCRCGVCHAIGGISISIERKTPAPSLFCVCRRCHSVPLIVWIVPPWRIIIKMPSPLKRRRKDEFRQRKIPVTVSEISRCCRRNSSTRRTDPAKW
jgi:hypothetical protein